MKVVLMGNNRVGLETLRYLIRERETEVVGVVVHPKEKAKLSEEIMKIASETGIRCLYGDRLHEKKEISLLRKLEPDIGISAFFGYVIRREAIACFRNGIINIHPAFLPYNRGSYPNVWSIVEGTPSGVTIHYIDEGIDTGDIIEQELVEVHPTDNGMTLYKRLEQVCCRLFKETWPRIMRGDVRRVKQDTKAGSTHSLKDVNKIDFIDLDRAYCARELINLIRARTFPPYNGAYFICEGKKVFMRLELYSEDGR